MSDAAAEAFVHSQRILLDAEIRQETSVHLQTPLQLCGIALGHGLRAGARELCNQTWELTTGYGHRKDPTLNNTVDAIDYLVEVAADDARRLLSLISPQIHHVLTIRTERARARACGRGPPAGEAVPRGPGRQYEEHTHAGDWSHAEDSLRAYVEQAVRGRLAAGCAHANGCAQRFRMRWRGLNMQGRRVPQSGCVFLKSMLGGTLACCSVQMRPAIATASHIPATLRCMPEQLDDLLASLSTTSYDEEERLLRAWYEHWDRAGQGRRLLAALDGLLQSDEGRRKGVLELSDLAFETRRKLSGPKAAWKYLVQAQIRNGAWVGFAENEDKTRKRLDMVVKHFPSRCDEFVAATTYAMFGEPEPPRGADGAYGLFLCATKARCGGRQVR